MRPSFLGLLILTLAAGDMPAAQAILGGQSDAFSLVQKPAGARALALGGAYEALADDASGLLWNPAAPGQAQSFGLAMHHEDWLANTSREMVTVQMPAAPWLGLGAYGTMVRYPGLDLRDSSGQALGFYTPQEQALGLTAALVSDRLSLGVTGRFMHLELPGYVETRGAGELGLLWQAAPSVRLAGVFKALPQSDGSVALNGVGAFSLSGAPGSFRWALSSSVRLDPQAASEWDLGAELGFGQTAPVALRAGYVQTLPAWSADLGQRFTMGAGVRFAQYTVDYAYLPWGDFGGTHRLSLSWSQPWRPSTPPPAPAKAAEPVAMPQPTPQAQAYTPYQAPAPVPSPPIRSTEARFRVLSDAVVAGRAYEAQGQWRWALQLYHQAATKDPNDLGAWKGMAGLYERGGQKAYAAQCWRQVQRLDPGDVEAQGALSRP